MIPKIIHQTWKTHDVPVHCRTHVETWKNLHPDWKYILWTDAELDDFIAAHYPDFLSIFRSYENGVQRADAARYLLLHHFGGIYTDIDTECLAPFDIFADESRIIFCEEPKANSKYVTPARTLKALLFNGTIASPAGHPFWLSMLKSLRGSHLTKSVLDSTGPCVLSATAQHYKNQDAFSINSAHLFCGKDGEGRPLKEARVGDYGDRNLSVHHWMGSWYKREKYPLWDKVESNLRGLIYHARRERQFKPKIEKSYLASKILPFDRSENIAVLIPVRDAEPFLNRCMSLLGKLEWPKAKLHITFCEGDSTDGTVLALTKIATENQFGFGSISIIHKSVKTKFTRDRRWLPKLQRQRRSGLAQVRNHLIDNAIKPETKWALWIDVDVNDYPPTVLHQLLAEQEKIIVPHCQRDDGSGTTFDLNSFATVYDWRDTFYFKHIIGGIYQPPQNCGRRLHMHDTRYLDKLPLNGVGGTLLLVDANVHRAGIRFPDAPYKDLIETEAFGQLARDCGVTPMGLPNLIITHPA